MHAGRKAVDQGNQGHADVLVTTCGKSPLGSMAEMGRPKTGIWTKRLSICKEAIEAW